MTRAAFFDVDHTLTTSVGLFRFLSYWYAATGRPPHHYVRERQRFKAMTAAGIRREETNRAYFGLYAGVDRALVEGLARDWFTAELTAGGHFNEPVLTALHDHRAAGDLIVLVSGSFPALLEPLADQVGAHHILCSEPETDPVTDTYTGRLVRRPHQPMIGQAKADAVRLFAAAHRIDLAASTAYGDHVSDVPMLETAGRAVRVGCDPTLRQLGARSGWGYLPGAPDPHPLPLPDPAAVRIPERLLP
ncbi:HAD family hydrolase [Streptomyces sp. NPDC048337]|uniref:HAD family hydrolase n=1 Tax=Streptomyces sp. NPDC048337 TaxID=3365535 RepID=UPI003717D14E